MNALVARPAAGRVHFTLPWTCPCGRARAVLARGIDPRQPLAPHWRAIGACPACGREGRWRIETRPDEYLVRVEVTHG